MVNNINPGATPANLRRVHRGMALSLIEGRPGISRAEIARQLGFSDMAATRIVRELLAAELVEEFESAARPKKRKSVGRPKTGLRIVARSLFAVGITVSAYHSEVSICDAAGDVQASRRVPDHAFDTVESTARIYAQAVRDLIEETSVDVARIVGIGIALSARTDPERGRILTSEYFGWENDGGQFCRAIAEIIDLPVEIENIANALAIAEMRFGVARGVREFALAHVATFVGASIVSEGRIVRGAQGISGLIGHFRSESSALTCVCSRQDCLNLSATGFGLLSRLGRLKGTTFDRRSLTGYASSLLDALDSDASVSEVAATGARIAPAIDAMAKLLGPEMVILGGTLGADETYFEGARAALSREFGLSETGPFRLVRGTVSPGRSAALLALHAFCYSDRLDYDRFADTASTAGVAIG